MNVRMVWLPLQETILLDVFAWVCFHLGIGYWCSRLPLHWFDPAKRLYQTRPWEKNGEVYQHWLRVRSWKDLIPNGSALYPDTFSIKKLPSVDLAYLERWLVESCRAEFCHWVMILPGFLFFLWNSVELGWWMVVYAVLNNVVVIVLQRFNRPRMRRLLSRMQREAARSRSEVDLRKQENVPFNDWRSTVPSYYKRPVASDDGQAAGLPEVMKVMEQR